jgi:hypothetical protein
VPCAVFRSAQTLARPRARAIAGATSTTAAEVGLLDELRETRPLLQLVLAVIPSAHHGSRTVSMLVPCREQCVRPDSEVGSCSGGRTAFSLFSAGCRSLRTCTAEGHPRR